MNQATTNQDLKHVHKNKHRAPRKPLDLPTLALSVGTLGFMRPAPGTWGTLPPAALAFVLLLAGAGTTAITVAMLALCIAASAACVVWGDYAIKRFRRKDAAEVVADETAGGAIPFLFLPAAVADDASLRAVTQADDAVAAFVTAAAICAIGFLAFRALDIAKLQPARALEKLPKGWGVLLDDIMAGIYAALVTQLLVRAFF